MIVWEELHQSRGPSFLHGESKLLRTKVPGGCLVKLAERDVISITFYPDPQHKWDGKSLR